VARPGHEVADVEVRRDERHLLVDGARVALFAALARAGGVFPGGDAHGEAFGIPHAIERERHGPTRLPVLGRVAVDGDEEIRVKRIGPRGAEVEGDVRVVVAREQGLDAELT